MELKALVSDIADALFNIDQTRVPFRTFQPGVGPYGEPQLLKLVAERLNRKPEYLGSARTKRTPDILIPEAWAIEVKIARPFGDNGKEAENWSVNLLHPYPGNASSLGDCLKLLHHVGQERKAIVVIGYEHVPALIDLTVLMDSFQAIATQVLHVRLSARLEASHVGLVHPVHQSLRVFAWEVLGVNDS